MVRPRSLISGMHSSITAHVVNDYLIDEATMTWGPNLEMFKWRLGNPAVKDRCGRRRLLRLPATSWAQALAG